MATHFSILAWRIYGQRSLVGHIQSTGLQRVGHDQALTHTANPVSLRCCPLPPDSCLSRVFQPEMWPCLEQCGKRLFKKVFVEFVIMLLLLFMFRFLAIRRVRSQLPRPGMEPLPPGIGRQILNPWTAQVVPKWAHTNGCSSRWAAVSESWTQPNSNMSENHPKPQCQQSSDALILQSV